LGGAFVGFVFHGTGEFRAEAVELGLAELDGIVHRGDDPGTGVEDFAGVMVGAILGAFDNAAELVEEKFVVLGAAEETGVLELLPRHAAVGAAGGGGIGDLGMGFEELTKKFVNWNMGLLDVAGFLGAGVAEVDFVGFTPGDFGHMDRCGFIASFAEMLRHG
jgi:hypothetical protein